MASVVINGDTSGAVTLAAPAVAGTTTLSLPATTGTVGLTTSQIGMKNRIINGAMMIDQRSAGAAVTTNTYCPDRWRVEQTTDGAFSAQQVSDAPAGFVNSLKWTVTTADASLGATQYATIRQGIEGFNVADLNWGTANAKTVTLSFWVKSSVTGTFGGVFGNGDFNRSYPFTYVISSANTWEQKSITITGDTAGTWNTTNGAGIQLYIALGSGSTYSGTAGSWQASGLITVTGTVNLMATLNATWQITGVQLELGSAATTFDFRSYGTELALCQRYYEICGAAASYPFLAIARNDGICGLVGYFAVDKRATPTMTWTFNTGSAYAAGNITVRGAYYLITTSAFNSVSYQYIASSEL